VELAATAPAGLASTEPPTPLAETPHFHWASAGKALTAAVVMQLVEEEKLEYSRSPAARERGLDDQPFPCSLAMASATC
jgi:hypothetical protein